MIPAEIQQWISKDAEHLHTCTKQQFDKYVEWFTNPGTDHEFNHYKAISLLIEELKDTK